MNAHERFPVVETAALIAGILFFLAAACGESDAATIVEKPQQKGGYAFETELSIGGPDAPDESYFYERFGSVRVDADANGRIYVLDNGNVRIQVFGPDGTWLRSLGAEGEGPGEFGMMDQFSVNAGGDVAVHDMGQGRVTVLDAEGRLLYDVAGRFGVEGLVLRDDRSVLLGFGPVGPARVVAYGPDGEERWKIGGASEPAGGRVVNITLPRQTIAPRFTALADGRSFRVPRGEYLLERFGATGDEVGALARPFERQRISAEEMAPPSGDDEEGGAPTVVMIRQEVAGGGGGHGGGAPSGRARVVEGDSDEITMTMDDISQHLPKFHPDTRGVLAFPDGRLWVVTAEDGRRGTVTDEWDADGRWVRRFALPETWDRVRIGRDGALYGVTHDEDDYPTVHRISVRSL